MKIVSIPDSLVGESETSIVERANSPLDGIKVLVTRDAHLNPICHVMCRMEPEDFEDLANGGSLIISFKNDGVPDFNIITVHK